MNRVRATYVEDPVALGERLRAARAGAGLTQIELAFPGCSAGYISRIETGDRVPSLQVLRELSRRVGVSESFLRTGREATLVGSSELVDAEIALRMGDLEQARGLYEDAIGEVRTDSARAEVLEGLGHIASQEGNCREAIDLFEEALRLTAGGVVERPRLAEALGRSFATIGELPPAIAVFRECLEHFAGGDPVQYVRFACLLSYALSDAGDYAEAERVVAKALERGREVADPYSRSRIYWSQSRVLLERGKSDLAERYALKTLETLRVTEDMYALGHAHQMLATIYLDLGRPREAAETLHDGWPLISSSATPLELAHYHIDQARALAALGEKQEAAALAVRALQQLGDALPVDSGRALLLLAEIFRDVGDRARAHELFTSAIDRLDGDRPTRYLIAAYKGLAQLLKEDGRVEEALDVFERALHAQERSGVVLA